MISNHQPVDMNSRGALPSRLVYIEIGHCNPVPESGRKKRNKTLSSQDTRFDAWQFATRIHYVASAYALVTHTLLEITAVVASRLPADLSGSSEKIQDRSATEAATVLYCTAAIRLVT